jgi:hypothetical protein
MRFFRLLYDRLISWNAARRFPQVATVIPDFVNHDPSIGRDVSRQGVRFFSLCASCGARLEASATLCEDCAQKRSRAY